MSSTNKSISELRTTVAAANEAADQVASKVSTPKKMFSGGTGVQGGCAPDQRAVSEESEGGDTMGVSEGGEKIESIQE